MSNVIKKIEISDIQSYQTVALLLSVKESIRKGVDEYLAEERFNYVITSVNIEEVDNTDFNKTKNLFESAVKKVVDSESGQINELKAFKKEIVDKIEKKRKERVLEVEKASEEIFKIRKENIDDEMINLFQVCKEQSSVEIDLTILKDFVEIAKTKKIYDVNSKGLSTSAKTKIKAEFDKVANPLIEQKRVQDEIEKEQKFLSISLGKIATSGTDEELQKSLSDLESLKLDTEVLYSNIPNAISQIENYEQNVKKSLELNQQQEKRQIQMNSDLELLVEMKSFDLYGVELCELVENYNKFASKCNNVKILDENKREMNKILDEMDKRTKELKSLEFQKKQIPASTTTPKEGLSKECQTKDLMEDIATQKVAQKRKYKLNSADAKLLSEISIDAESESEAKEIMISRFTSHIEMIKLEEV